MTVVPSTPSPPVAGGQLADALDVLGRVEAAAAPRRSRGAGRSRVSWSSRPLTSSRLRNRRLVSEFSRVAPVGLQPAGRVGEERAGRAARVVPHVPLVPYEAGSHRCSSQCWTAARTCASISRAASSPRRSHGGGDRAVLRRRPRPATRPRRRGGRAGAGRPRPATTSRGCGRARRCPWRARARSGTRARRRARRAPERAFSSRAIDARKAGQVGFGAARGGEARDPRLEDQPHLEPAQHGVEPEVGRPEPAVRCESTSPSAGKPAQRLAHGRAGDPQPLGEFDLPERACPGRCRRPGRAAGCARRRGPRRCRPEAWAAR